MISISQLELNLKVRRDLLNAPQKPEIVAGGRYDCRMPSVSVIFPHRDQQAPHTDARLNHAGELLSGSHFLGYGDLRISKNADSTGIGNSKRTEKPIAETLGHLAI